MKVILEGEEAYDYIKHKHAITKAKEDSFNLVVTSDQYNDTISSLKAEIASLNRKLLQSKQEPTVNDQQAVSLAEAFEKQTVDKPKPSPLFEPKQAPDLTIKPRQKTSKYKWTQSDYDVIHSAVQAQSSATRTLLTVYNKLGNTTAVWPEAAQPSWRSFIKQLGKFGYTYEGKGKKAVLNKKG